MNNTPEQACPTNCNSDARTRACPAKPPGRSGIEKLVEQFDRNIHAYKSPQYNETELRVEFVNPFWSALGWDMENKAGYAMAYRDVIHEDAVKVGTATKAPDYCFRIGGMRKFFLETKRPARDLKADPAPAYQLRRYGWSAKLPLSVLTDFEEMIVYDCRLRPRKTDKASHARILYIHFKDYPAKWEELSAIFSREAVLKGSFDRYVQSVGGKRGTAEVDVEFLKEIEGWRDVLARNIALRNPRLTDRELNFAVQMTIDRIIFLRMCEDRGIEPYGQLQALCGGPRIYRRLVGIYQKADERYNSGLFHFQPEKDRDSLPDALTPKLAVDDKALKEIFQRLYYPDSPYEFRILPPEILGNVYEQFLGKVIRLTTGHQAKIEEKPEVRKAGGVYYTPSYIVDYIVKNTVGNLLGEDSEQKATPARPPGEGAGGKETKKEVRMKLTPAQASRLRILDGTAIPSPLAAGEGRGEGSAEENNVGAALAPRTPAQVSRLRILDPACGSGSFLLGAYQYLLDWHLKTYLAEKEKTGKIPTMPPEAGQRRRKSSMPVMYQGQGGDWLLTTVEKKRILLNNIYGVDIDQQAVEVTKLSLLLKVLENENQDSLNSQLTLWRERALPDLSGNIKCGNSLIGPDFYQNRQTDMFNEENKYRINAFDWQAEFPDIFKAGGFDAVIGNPPYGAYLYEQDKTYLKARYPIQTYQLDSYLLFLESSIRNLLTHGGFYGMIIPNPWLTNLLQTSIRKFIIENTRVCSIVHFQFPVFPKVVVDTEVVVLQKKDPKNWQAEVAVVDTIEAFLSRPWAIGVRQIKHVQQKWRDLNGGVINIFTSESEENLAAKCQRAGVQLESFCVINVGIKPYQTGKGTPPQTKRIVDERPFDSDSQVDASYRPYLRGKDIGRFKIAPVQPRYLRYGPWLAEPRPAANFDAPVKIMMRQTGDSLIASLDTEKFLCLNNMHVLVPRNDKPSPFYLIGVINSRLLNWYYHTLNPEVGEALAEVKKTNVAKLPIRTIDISNAADKSRHDRMVALVDSMLELHKKVQAAKTPNEKTRLERQISATDREIDQLVYELYGLTDEEIKIVESVT